MRAGRYALQAVIGRGGAATVHLAKLAAIGDFARIVAIKRLHPDVARDDAEVKALVDEARLASRVRSANVVPTLDVVAEGGEVFVVMEYVAGETLARLIATAARNDEPIPPRVALAIVADVLRGLRAAHEATAADGTPLALVHRDVSPQNVIVGEDGTARLLDFGIAKARGSGVRTKTGIVKGKLGYMPPEQLRGQPLDARTDLYALGVVGWEALVGDRLFHPDDGDVVDRVMRGDVVAPSARGAEVDPAIDAIVLRALAVHPAERFASAAKMLAALEAAAALASPTEVAAFVARIAHDSLAERAALVAACEAAPVSPPPEAPVPIAPATRRGRALAIGGAAGLAVALATFAVSALSPKRDARAPEAVVASIAPRSDRAPAPEPDAPPLASASEPRPAPRPHVVAPRSAPAARSRCSPPYVIDPDGHKRWKRECF